ncbi:MAG: Peptidase T, partial [Candidatus Lokiarchaeum sp. GC14_75]
FSEFPEAETPEHTEKREGYFHLSQLHGNAEEAKGRMIIRDFKKKNNETRMSFIKNLKILYETRFPGLKIEITFKHQYQNMLNFITKKPLIVELAKQAIEKTGLEVKVRPIRGGTDGSRLSAKGILTPNIFTGGLLGHSRKEHIPTIGLQKSAEALLYLAELWTNEK